MINFFGMNFCLHLLSISLVERPSSINTGSKGIGLFFRLFTLIDKSFSKKIVPGYTLTRNV